MLGIVMIIFIILLVISFLVMFGSKFPLLLNILLIILGIMQIIVVAYKSGLVG